MAATGKNIKEVRNEFPGNLPAPGKGRSTLPMRGPPSRLCLCNLLTPGVEKWAVGLSGTFAFKLFRILSN